MTSSHASQGARLAQPLPMEQLRPGSAGLLGDAGRFGEHQWGGVGSIGAGGGVDALLKLPALQSFHVAEQQNLGMVVADDVLVGVAQVDNDAVGLAVVSAGGKGRGGQAGASVGVVAQVHAGQARDRT